MLKRNGLVAEAVVLGDRRRFASALIVPDFAALERRLRELGRPPATHSTSSGSSRAPSRDERGALVLREDVRALYQDVVDGLNRDLSQFERIKKIRLLPREFTIESGELTPTMKVKRKVVEQKWAREIDEMYRDLPREAGGP